MTSELLEIEGSRLTVINCVIFVIVFKLFFLPFSNVPVPKIVCYVKQIIACIYFTVSLLVYYKYITAKFIVSCCVFYKHWRSLGFFCSINHLVDLLGNRCLLERVQKVMVCDLWSVDFYAFCLFELCFKVCCLWLSSLVQSFFWSFLRMSTPLARMMQFLALSLDKNSTHHGNFLRYSWAV